MIQFPARARQVSNEDRGEFDPLPQPPSLTPFGMHPDNSVTSFDIGNSRPSTMGSSAYLLNNYSSATLIPGAQTPGTSTPPPRPPFNTHRGSFSDASSYDGATRCQTPALMGDEFSNEDLKKEDPATLRKVHHFNTFGKRYDPTTFSIETLDKHDDVEFLPPWKRNMYRLSPLFTFLACGSYFLYYSFRIHCTIQAQQAYNKVYIMAWIFIAAEGCVACKYINIHSNSPEVLTPITKSSLFRSGTKK